VLDAFLQHHPAINVSKYVEELKSLDAATTQSQQK
jgi:hypothetical protein